MRCVIFSLAVFCFAVSSCKKEESDKDQNKPAVFAASGEVQSKIDEFRTLLGPLNTTLGATSGRREINWDGVPDQLLNKTLPSDFFNPVGDNAVAARQRGLAYDATGNFQVSNTSFAHVNAAAAAQFTPFSGDKTFASVSRALWEIKFQVPGQTTAGWVKGFGAVFSDVDIDGSTSLEFFNEETSLGKFSVPKSGASSKFSFLGVYFQNDKITNIKVSHNGKLDDGKNDISNGGTDDLIVLDDFIYSEPRP